MKPYRYKIYAILSLIFIVFLSLFFFFEKKATREVTINNKTITAEIADTSAKRSRGLMFRESLGENEGMLFIFDNEDYHSIWMLNMKIPLDIIWISKDKEIVYIKRSVPTCDNRCPNYAPSEKALYVLEVNANYTLRNNVNVGDIVHL